MVCAIYIAGWYGTRFQVGSKMMRSALSPGIFSRSSDQSMI
jgi:hypothetical protein